MNQLRQPVNKSEWISHSDLANVNAFHYFEENSIGEYNFYLYYSITRIPS